MDIAVIPARSGSKRIKEKNIRPFLGKPMMAYSIEAALSSGCFGRVIVSTDSHVFARIAEEHGAETLLRPAELADDHTPLAPVVEHALRETSVSAPVERVCCILSTAPFVRPSDLRAGRDLLTERCVGSVFSVTTFPFPIFRGLRRAEDGTLSMFWPEHEMTRSNDLPEGYHDAGQFYWLEATRFLAEKRIYMPDALGVVLPRHLVQDIDTPEDWRRAELMYGALLQTGELEGER